MTAETDSARLRAALAANLTLAQDLAATRLELTGAAKERDEGACRAGAGRPCLRAAYLQANPA